MRKFFKSKRPLVASDSTLKRNIGKMYNDELFNINYELSKNKEISQKLINPYLNRVCGIMDGTGMSKFLKEVFLIPGEVDYIYHFNAIPKKGKELKSAEKMMEEIGKKAGKDFFDLLLFDGLYYSKNIFKQAKDHLNAKCLVKTCERLNVIKDVEFYIKSDADIISVKEGQYDDERLCKYKITVAKNVNADTIEGPLQVAIVEEYYTKKNKTEIFYIITNDLDLNVLELRYAAHIRWRIENNAFKLLNKLFETKRKISVEEDFVTNLLWIIFIAYNMFMLFLNHCNLDEIVNSTKTTFKYWLDKIYQSLIIMFSSKSYYNTG